VFRLANNIHGVEKFLVNADRNRFRHAFRDTDRTLHCQR
jgi:hypothetical protein